MRDTIDFGIDLGTTNSAIAVADGGDVQVLKNLDSTDTTPSVVRMTKPGAFQVGMKARNHWNVDPENVAAEFKLQMGLAGASRYFPAGETSLTPPELSAEVLKSLRANATQRLGAPPEAAVITVPAAFGLNQSKATSDAAALAGFTGKCPLVQEPTAAAFAYGLRDTTASGYWLVFDLGGGTFDAAIVSKRDGELTVLHHAGDSYLGGSLIDWAIVEQLLVPVAADLLHRKDLTRDNPDLGVVRTLARLKLAAEQAKIELSTMAATTIDDVRLYSGDRTVDFEYELTRADVERLARPYYTRAVDCCRTALSRGELRTGDIDRVLLVGGPTLAPGLRQLLADPADGLGIELDFSQDPSTVVARGAALYASTVRVERKLAAPKAGRLTAKLEAPPSTTGFNPTVGGTLYSASTVDWTTYSVSLHDESAKPPFHGDEIRLSARGTFATDVPLTRHATSRFTLRVTDGTGERIPVEPDTMTIAHREVDFEGQVLSVPLSIGLADNSIAVLLAAGARLPSTVKESFVTSMSLHRDDQDAVIQIPVLRGDHARADRNPEVGMLEIRSRDLSFDLSEGTRVQLTMEADNSGLLSVVAEVDRTNLVVEAEIDLDNVHAPDPGALQEMLAELELRSRRLREDAGGSIAAQDQLAEFDRRDPIGTCRELVRTAAADQGAARAADEQLRAAHADLDVVSDAAALAGLCRELQDLVAECERLLRGSSREADRREVTDLRERADAAIATQDAKAVRRLLDRAGRLIVDLLREEPDFPLLVFRSFCEHRHELRPASEVKTLIREGERAAAAGDMHTLQQVNGSLRRLTPPDLASSIGGLVRHP